MDERYNKFMSGFNEDYHLSRNEMNLTWVIWKAAQPQWQPIETAPVKNDYLPEVLCTNGEKTEVSFYDRGYWSGFMGDEAQPTHWMPLPPQQ